MPVPTVLSSNVDDDYWEIGCADSGPRLGGASQHAFVLVGKSLKRIILEVLVCSRYASSVDGIELQ